MVNMVKLKYGERELAKHALIMQMLNILFIQAKDIET
jgi:hypothetical protein